MATTIRDYGSQESKLALTNENLMRLGMMKLVAGTIYHMDASPALASPSAVDLPSTIVAANALKAGLNTHFASVCDPVTGQGVHLTADATNVVAAATAVDLATSITLLNACKASFNAHLTQATVHPKNDTTNTNATTNASDLPTSQTLANALQTSINAHFAAAFTEQATAFVAP